VKAQPHPVIVVPGITATYLRDQYYLPPQNVWAVLSKEYARVTLHPDDLRYELKEPSRVVPDQAYDLAYGNLIEELRFNLPRRRDEDVPVYPFGYDWRQPLEETERILDAFVEEVIDRTRLMPSYNRDAFDENPRVDFVGHSMGGLIITGYLERYGHKRRVRKVVTLATPFRGSFEAVVKVATGTADLGTDHSGHREREAARLTPSLYYLIPDVRQGLLPEKLPDDALFDPANWQSSVVRSIADVIRQKGTRRDRHRQRGLDLFTRLLQAARRHRERIKHFDLSSAGLTAGDWLAVVGVDAETRVRLKLGGRGKKVQFVLSARDRDNRWGDADPGKRIFTGDGTVPYAGAVPPFLPANQLVCVTPDDFGYWELADRVLTKAAGFHGILPNMNMIHRLITCFLAAKKDKYGNTWGRPAPEIENWQPPIAGLRNKDRR